MFENPWWPDVCEVMGHIGEAVVLGAENGESWLGGGGVVASQEYDVHHFIENLIKRYSSKSPWNLVSDKM